MKVGHFNQRTFHITKKLCGSIGLVIVLLLLLAWNEYEPSTRNVGDWLFSIYLLRDVAVTVGVISAV